MPNPQQTADEQDLVKLGGPSRRHWHVPIGANVTCSPPPGYDRDAFRGSRLRVAPESSVVAYFGLLNASKSDRGQTILTTFRLTGFEAAPDDFPKVLADTRKTYPPEEGAK